MNISFIFYLTGSPAFITSVVNGTQTIPLHDSLTWEYDPVKRHVGHITGKAVICVERDGIYNIYADAMTEQAGQWTLFINGQPDMSTVFGRESGASRCVIRQFVKLNRGDLVTLRNYESNAGTLNLAINAGGFEPGNGAMITLFMLDDGCGMPPPPKK